MLRFLLIFFDLLAALISWASFYSYRKLYIEHSELVLNDKLYYGLLIIPLIWLIIYTFQGTYYQPKRLHRARIIAMTLSATLLGSLVIFFVFILDDVINTYQEYYQSILGLMMLHFILTILFRYSIISVQVNRIKYRKDGFNTLLVGNGTKAKEIYQELISSPHSTGNQFIGYVQTEEKGLSFNDLSLLASSYSENLLALIHQYSVEEVIIALEKKDDSKLKEIVAKIYPSNAIIKVLPDTYDLLSGSVRMVDIYGAILIEVEKGKMPYWQILMKRVIDIVFSLIALTLLLPVYMLLSIFVLFSSKGPIFFTQERIGLGGKPFQIIKFRTMVVGAENKGPQLSSDKDSRITSVGLIFRKYRLDELPQFFNVLKGDMSLVGPRPERQFFIDQIVEKDPQYLYLNSVRPGITSWGQVKFGYAENVNQMIQRMKYDLLYLKNRSLMLDFRILLGTIVTVVKAKGK